MPDLRLIDIAEAFNGENGDGCGEKVIERRHHTAALNLVHLAMEAEPDLRYLALDELDEYFQSKSPELGFSFLPEEGSSSEEPVVSLPQALVSTDSSEPATVVESKESVLSVENEEAPQTVVSTTLVEIQWDQDEEITDVISEQTEVTNSERAEPNPPAEHTEVKQTEVTVSELAESDTSISIQIAGANGSTDCGG